MTHRFRILFQKDIRWGLRGTTGRTHAHGIEAKLTKETLVLCGVNTRELTGKAVVSIPVAEARELAEWILKSS